MTKLTPLLSAETAQYCPPDAAEAIAARWSAQLGWDVYPRSVAAGRGAAYALARQGREKRLVVAAPASAGDAALRGWAGERRALDLDGQQWTAALAPAGPEEAERLRERLPCLRPACLGVRRALGLGDRLGLATPGHVQAVRGSGVAPVFAQQSIREMTRTQRTPQQVMDSAMWGAFQEGWSEPWGADADHLKTLDDALACARAGFTMFTFDPGDHVNDAADELDAAALRSAFDALPWDALETRPADLRGRYLGRRLPIDADFAVEFDEESLARAAVKYAAAVAHAAALYRGLAQELADRPFEVEVSVDETATPTSAAEHYFIAQELRRLGVEWASLAPRFVGEFEKGVDYQGSLEEFDRSYAQHAAIAHALGPYKVSMHSGSDKFSAYPVAARRSGDAVHVKTAGTSYLEALRAVGLVQPYLLREILAFARERYEQDKASYHVSASLDRAPKPEDLSDDELPRVLDDFHGRQVLHVTYGSVLTAEQDGAPRFKTRLLAALQDHEDVHYQTVARHLRRHVEPFAA